MIYLLPVSHYVAHVDKDETRRETFKAQERAGLPPIFNIPRLVSWPLPGGGGGVRYPSSCHPLFTPPSSFVFKWIKIFHLLQGHHHLHTSKLTFIDNLPNIWKMVW